MRESPFLFPTLLEHAIASSAAIIARMKQKRKR
jgi:hypothetical protein